MGGKGMSNLVLGEKICCRYRSNSSEKKPSLIPSAGLDCGHCMWKKPNTKKIMYTSTNEALQWNLSL